MPAEAFVPSDEAVAMLERGDRSILALSYGWLTALHPDPHGTTLAAVRRFLDADAAASDTTEDEAGQDLMPTGTLAVGAIIGIVVAVLIICLCIVICVFFGCFGICGVREERLVVKEGQPPPPSEPRRWTQVPVKFLAEQAGKTSPVNLSTRSFNTGTRQGTTPPYAKEKTHEDFVKEVAAGPTVHRL